MNIRHPAIIALLFILALALVIFGVSMYARTQSPEVASVLVILGLALAGSATFLSGLKNVTEFVAKFLNRRIVLPEAIERKRRIDAVAPNHASIGQLVDLLVQVRFPNSPLLTFEDWPSQRKPLEIEQAKEAVSLRFPLNPQTGKIGSAHLRIKLVAPEFEIKGNAQQALEVPPRKNSKIIAFLLRAIRVGLCRVNIEVYTVDNTYLGAIPIETSISDVPIVIREATVANLFLIVSVIPVLRPNATSTASSQDIRLSSEDRSVATGRDMFGTTITAPASSHPFEPNLVHPYALQANFTGRVNERKELTAWLSDNVHPICALVAMGGMGKSALAWYWVTRDVLPLPSGERPGEGRNSQSDPQLSPQPSPKGEGVDGVMWWSFYEGEASFAKFVDEALKYVSGREIDVNRLPTTYDRAQELRRELQNKRVLFVLDGFERQLRAYSRLDAAYQSDDATDPSREARSCVEPDAARLLKDIAAGTTRAKVLITSRLMVSDLEDRAGDPLAGVLQRELKEMARDDAIAFMGAQGVTKGTPSEIATVCEAYGNHPLSLRLLSGLIARDTRTPGDIAAAPRHDVHANLVARQHHVLEQSYNALPDKERTLLSRIAAFRSPMTYDALAIFNEFGDNARFDAALNDLQARGLVQRDTAHNRYDLHPIVRHYGYDRLTDKIGVHTRLRDYFAIIPMPDEEQMKSIEDLTPVIELYHHTVRAGRYDDARELFRDRIVQLLYFRVGAYQTCIELLGALFRDGEGRPPRLKSERGQGWTLNTLAISYSNAGQSRRSMPLLGRYISISEKLGDNLNQAIGLGNIAIQQIVLGELSVAEQSLRRSIELSCEITDEFNEAGGHQELGRLLAYRGAFDEAAREFDTALKMFEKQNQTQSICVVWAYRAQRALLMGDARAAIGAAQQARMMADEIAKARYPYESDIIRAEWLWGAALVMEGKDLNAAATRLTETLTRCRRINLMDLEPDILLAWARWHRARNNAQEAQVHAEEALAIADRCEYRLKQADIHNFLAHLALDEGNHAAARQHAEIAKERAWCDGPPHCYKPALDEAVKLINETEQ